MEQLKLRGDYITLGQLLKAAGLVDDGVEAKERIRAGEALVNGETDTRRGRKLREGDRGKKLYPGYVVSFHGTEIEVVREIH